MRIEVVCKEADLRHLIDKIYWDGDSSILNRTHANTLYITIDTKSDDIRTQGLVEKIRESKYYCDYIFIDDHDGDGKILNYENAVLGDLEEERGRIKAEMAAKEIINDTIEELRDKLLKWEYDL